MIGDTPDTLIRFILRKQPLKLVLPLHMHTNMLKYFQIHKLGKLELSSLNRITLLTLHAA